MMSAHLQRTNSFQPQPLTWSLVVATYRREFILPHCIMLAARQSRPPKEIAVVDASPDWQSSRERISREIECSHPHIRFVYERAIQPSLTAQRNQGLDLATADVVFLFDDDTLMHQGCAAEIMAIYDADTERAVVGVQAVLDVKGPVLIHIHQVRRSR
jgi:glycosyltransferase involved in cell wall biosynthesis